MYTTCSDLCQSLSGDPTLPLHARMHSHANNQTVFVKLEKLSLKQVLHTGDVIAFYNSVFVPAVKTDLLKINQDRASLARPPPTESLMGASPIRSFNRYSAPFAIAGMLIAARPDRMLLSMQPSPRSQVFMFVVE